MKFAGKSTSPSSSLHYRHAEPKPFITPAPGAYRPEKCEKKILDSSPKYSFGLKAKLEPKSNTPGTISLPISLRLLHLG